MRVSVYGSGAQDQALGRGLWNLGLMRRLLGHENMESSMIGVEGRHESKEQA